MGLWRYRLFPSVNRESTATGPTGISPFPWHPHPTTACGSPDRLSGAAAGVLWPCYKICCGRDCWDPSTPGHICSAKTKQNSMCSGPFVDGVQRPRLSSSEKAHTLNLTQLMWRALFFQTSKFRPSHCQRRHTELNEAAGWTNTANRIALTTNMAHIMLNYGPRHDWTHIQTGEAALRMARILNAIYQEHRGAKFLWEMFVFLLFYFFPLFVQILPLRTLWTLTH